jgi:hypothetical protein
MQAISFGTPEPFDHVPRALDILRTMGFGLHGLSIEKADDGVYRVHLRYEPRGELPAQTFLDRLARNAKLSSVLVHRADTENGSLCP